MGIQNFPAALQPIIQQGFLEKAFEDAILPEMKFRMVADKEPFAAGIGETITKTRRGLKAPIETDADPTTNTNLDNGMTPTGWTVEQYTMGISQLNDTIDLNMVTQKVGIANQFVENAKVNGVQSGQSVDRKARKALYGAYLSGNTYVTATLGAPGVTVAVDNVVGFDKVFVNGVFVPVSNTNPLTVTIGAGVYSVVGFAYDGSNTSRCKAFGGRSGTLTTSANVSVSNGTLGNAVVSAVAPALLRSSARASTTQLVSGDTLKLALLEDAVVSLRNSRTPKINGRYNCYLSPRSMRQLFSDQDFKDLFRGEYGAKEMKELDVVELVDLRFLPTTEAPQEPTVGGLKVERPIVVGGGALVESDFEAGVGYSDIVGNNAMIEVVEGVAMVTREPLDRLQQIVAQSWYWIGGFVAPTDITSNPTIIPTTSNAAYKRGVVIEHV